ncbi:hypothetical protein BDQ17DRAFT_1106995 [Cyathus striatus]|nr:hypothetical protein BDQ17DRAFT_1106995 [Cyathus striatus]
MGAAGTVYRTHPPQCEDRKTKKNSHTRSSIRKGGYRSITVPRAWGTFGSGIGDKCPPRALDSCRPPYHTKARIRMSCPCAHSRIGACTVAPCPPHSVQTRGRRTHLGMHNDTEGWML